MSSAKAKTKSESVSLETFQPWSFHSDFTYETNDDGRLSNLHCKICTKYVTNIRQEAKIRGIMGQSILSYVDGVN